MDIIRYGNDINVTWTVYGRNGAKYSLTNKIQHLWLVSGPRKKEISAYSLQARNQIVFVVDDTEINKLGTFKLILEIKEPESELEEATYELSHVFQVVSETYPMKANKAINGQTDIDIKSILSNVYISTLEGASAYEVAVENGFQGTVQEWLGGYVARIRCDWPWLIVTKADNQEIRVNLTHTHPDYQSAISSLQSTVANISLTSNDSYYTLRIGDNTINFYSKEQVDALISGGGSGDVTPESPEDAYLHFTKNEFLLDASGKAITSGGVGVEASNIPWTITGEAMPDPEEDPDPETNPTVNVYPQSINIEVGQTVQIQEV